MTDGTAELRGVHHVGIAVRSLDKSLAWYREVFGVEPHMRLEADGPDVDAAVQLENVRVEAALLDVGNTVIELLEYKSPVGADFRLRNCDVGAIHVALDVANIDEAYERLRSRGAVFSNAPAMAPEGPLEGYRFCYFRDPDGIQFELFERPRPA